MEILLFALLCAVLVLQIMLMMKLSPGTPRRRRKSTRPAWEPKNGEKAAAAS